MASSQVKTETKDASTNTPRVNVDDVAPGRMRVTIDLALPSLPPGPIENALPSVPPGQTENAPRSLPPGQSENAPRDSPRPTIASPLWSHSSSEVGDILHDPPRTGVTNDVANKYSVACEFIRETDDIDIISHDLFTLHAVKFDDDRRKDTAKWGFYARVVGKEGTMPSEAFEWQVDTAHGDGQRPDYPPYISVFKSEACELLAFAQKAKPCLAFKGQTWFVLLKADGKALAAMVITVCCDTNTVGPDFRDMCHFARIKMATHMELNQAKVDDRFATSLLKLA